MVINTVFGVGISILLVRYKFRGKALLNALLDMPLSVSPIVVGLALIQVYGGRNGWFGPTLEDAGFKIIFATPGIVLATVFVVAAVDDPRGGAGARRDRDGPGAGGVQPGRQRVADVPPHHAAVDQAGRSCTASC